jgi:hypothetical protein
VTDPKIAQRRAKNKKIAQEISLSMIDFAKADRVKDLMKALWNTYYCQYKIRIANGKVYGDYCKNLWCPLCNGNRLR